jgi:hypothetical protein
MCECRNAIIFDPLQSHLHTTMVLCWSYLNSNIQLIVATIMNCFVFYYNLHKTDETLLSVMKLWSARIKVPTVQILTVWTVFCGVYRCCCWRIENGAILFTVVWQRMNQSPVFWNMTLGMSKHLASCADLWGISIWCHNLAVFLFEQLAVVSEDWCQHCKMKLSLKSKQWSHYI